MKKYFAALSATALISVAPFALAASSTDLTVTGFITPSACEPQWSNGGVIEIGQLLVRDLNPTRHTTLTRVDATLSVACDEPTVFALKAVDNNPGTAFDGYSFGLGLTDADEKLGAFLPYFKSVEADGVAARFISSVNGQDGWYIATMMRPGEYTSTSATADPIPLAVENLVFNVGVQAWIAPTNGLTLTQEVTIDGSATFEMKYL